MLGLHQGLDQDQVICIRIKLGNDFIIGDLCCSELEVEGVKYKFKEIKDTSKYNCRDNCVYMDPANNTAEFCFGTGSSQSVCTGKHKLFSH